MRESDFFVDKTCIVEGRDGIESDSVEVFVIGAGSSGIGYRGGGIDSICLSKWNPRIGSEVLGSLYGVLASFNRSPDECDVIISAVDFKVLNLEGFLRSTFPVGDGCRWDISWRCAVRCNAEGITKAVTSDVIWEVNSLHCREQAWWAGQNDQGQGLQ